MTIDYADPTQVEAAVHAQLEDLDPLDAVAVLDDVRAALVDRYARKILADHFAVPDDVRYQKLTHALVEARGIEAIVRADYERQADPDISDLQDWRTAEGVVSGLAQARAILAETVEKARGSGPVPGLLSELRASGLTITDQRNVL